MGLAAVAIPWNPSRTDETWLRTLFSLQQGERFQPEASSVSKLGCSLLPMSQLRVWAGTQPVPRVPRHRQPGGGKDSKVLLRAHELVTASGKSDRRSNPGNQMGYRLRKAANCKLREKGWASQLCGLFWAKCPSRDRLQRWASVTPPGLLPPCTPQEPPSLQLWPSLCNSTFQPALLLPEKRPQLQDSRSDRGWFIGRKVRHC